VVEGIVSGGLRAHIVVRRSADLVVDVPLAVGPGETIALLGPNGAGKSTVVASLAGSLALDEGSISLGDMTFDDPAAGVFVAPEHRNVGVVLQDRVLFPHLTVLENVAFGLRSRAMRRTVARTAAEDWLGRLGVADLADRAPGTLSGGQAQLVALARALAAGPDLLVLDEPLAAMDVAARSGMRRILARHLATFSGPKIVVTHEPAEAFLLADVIHVVEHGRVTQVGTADDIRRRPKTTFVSDLVGINLVSGTAAAGDVAVTEDTVLHVADTGVSGPVLATIHPRSISLHGERPTGSPRNVWQAEILYIEPLGDRIRVQLGPPLPLTAEVTPAAVAALHLHVGGRAWVSIKATEIAVEPDDGG
jgi:molybdate transport system ATP-binding protein